MTDHAALIRRSLEGGHGETFDRRVRRQGDALVEAVRAGRFDNEAVTLGLELEAYAVRETDGGLRLTRIPDDFFEEPAAKELGLHNVELNTTPSAFDEAGIADQLASLEADLATVRERARDGGLEIVLDAMWAVPPVEGSRQYLGDVEEVRSDEGSVDGNESVDVSRGRDEDRNGDGDESVGGDRNVDEGDPILVARNMRRDPRYGALDNEAVRRAGGEIEFSVPGADLSFRSILFESLATSIQPHVQVPDADAFPRYHNLAVRTLGPLLALSTNSPFLPADCYDVDDPADLVERTHHELRIAAFEQSMNQRCRKVRVPRDLGATADVVDHVVEDDTFAPFLREWLDDEATPADGPAAEVGEGDETLVEACWEFDYKRSTFWRWVRGVVGGTAVDGACGECSLRIEYRPLPTQPTAHDVVGLQALTAGLLHGLVVADHPLESLPRAAAERSFYDAARAGLGADLAWVDADGDRTSDPDRIFDEVFDYAHRGLDDRGVPPRVRDRYLDPLEARWEQRTTPSVWKIERVRAALDGGADLAGALERMQREYVDRSRERETFADWL